MLRMSFLVPLLSWWFTHAAAVTIMSAFSSPTNCNNQLIGKTTTTNGLQHRYFALRHGQSKANVLKIISSDPVISTVQHGLSDKGKQQVEAMARIFCLDDNDYADYKIAIVSSDFLRARETAEIFASHINSERQDDSHVTLDTRLRERFFESWNGGPDSHYKDVWAKDAQDASHTEWGVEPVNSVMRRTTKLILYLEHQHQTSSTPLLYVLVAHGDVLQILQTAFSKLDGSLHRTMPHLETASLRELILEGPVNSESS